MRWTRAAGSLPAAGAARFYEPTVIVGVTQAMKVASEETFAPLAPIIAFKDEEKMKSMSKHEALTEQAIPAKFRPNKSGQYIEFVNACKGEDVCFSDVDHSVPMLEGMLVGCIAQQVPGKLEWSSRKQQFVNNPAANALVRPYVRPGWEF